MVGYVVDLGCVCVGRDYVILVVYDFELVDGFGGYE